MIGAFPELLQDELLYSGFARFAEMFGYRSDSTLRQALLGTSSATFVVDLPGRIDQLTARLPPNSQYTSERLITGYTLTPYFESFLPKDRAQLARTMQRGVGNAAVHGLLNPSVHRVWNPRKLRFCPRCLRDDTGIVGSGVWRRAHQVPGVALCPLHAEPLRDSSVERADRSRRTALFSLSASTVADSVVVSLPSAGRDHLLAIAEDSAWLLSDGRAVDDPDMIGERYRELVAARGWLLASGRMAVARIERAFLGHYGRSLLEYLNQNCDGMGLGNSWLSRLLQLPHRPQPPLRHLLIMRFLGVTASEFFRPLITGASSVPSGPVGAATPSHGVALRTAPAGDADRTLEAPCRNPVCPKFAKPTRNDANDPTLAGRRIRCPECEFEYRTSPGTSKIWKVVAVGPLWTAEFRRLSEQTPPLGLTTVAAVLRVSPPSLQKWASQLGIVVSKWAKLPTRPAHEFTGGYDIAGGRATILDLLRLHPEAGRSELARSDRWLYHFLMRNDRKWLEGVLPKPRSGPPRRRDWSVWDEELRSKVPAIVEGLYRQPGKPRRVGAHRIAAGFSNRSSLYSARRHLPRTWAAVESAAETDAAFATRTLDWVTADFVGKRLVPTPAALVAAANLRGKSWPEGRPDPVQICAGIARLIHGA